MPYGVKQIVIACAPYLSVTLGLSKHKSSDIQNKTARILCYFYKKARKLNDKISDEKVRKHHIKQIVIIICDMVLLVFGIKHLVYAFIGSLQHPLLAEDRHNKKKWLEWVV